MYPLRRRFGGQFKGQKFFLTLPGIEPRLLRCLTHGLVTTLTAISRLIKLFQVSIPQYAGEWVEPWASSLGKTKVLNKIWTWDLESRSICWNISFVTFHVAQCHAACFPSYLYSVYFFKNTAVVLLSKQTSHKMGHREVAMCATTYSNIADRTQKSHRDPGTEQTSFPLRLRT